MGRRQGIVVAAARNVAKPMRKKRTIPAEVQAAIAAFLNECQKEAKPFAAMEALGALRTIFPQLDISDSDLEDAISGEAASAGFDIDRGSRDLRLRRRKAGTEEQRRIDNDTAGTRRRARATKERNDLI
jgi:hypothetical protein